MAAKSRDWWCHQNNFCELFYPEMTLKNFQPDQISVTTPHFHKCQGEPMKKAKNSQGLGKAMIIENLYTKKTY